MDETEVMTTTTSLALLSNKLQQVAVFEKETCDAGLATGHGEAGVLHEQGRPLLADNVEHSSLEELQVVLQLELTGVVHDQLDEVDKLDVAPEHGGE